MSWNHCKVWPKNENNSKRISLKRSVVLEADGMRRVDWSWFLIFPKGTFNNHWQRRCNGGGGRERRKRGQTSRSWKGADYPWRNNRLDVHGHPVNGNHFKRSRPQCVYLANVKFTRGKRKAACTLANTLLPLFISCRCFLRVPSKIGSFCRARSSALGRGSCSPIVNLWLFSSQVLSVS